MNQPQITTRTYRFHQPGGPEVLRLDDLPTPEPAHGEVRVRVEAMGLNRADLLWLANTYIESPKPPSRLGYEITGTVEAVGPEVAGLKVGDRVSSLPAFAISDYGNFAESAVLPARALMPTPASFSAAQGAGFAFAYFTGYLALLEMARLQPYQSVLVTAAGSTTGLAAIAIARKLGATVIATSRTGKKRDGLLAAGAHHVIATDEEDLVARVMEITGGQGVDLVYDCIAGAIGEKLVQATRVRGLWIVYGAMDMNPAPFPLWPVFVRSVRFATYKVFDFTGHRVLGLPADEPALARAREFIAGGLADGSLPVKIDREFQGLESLPEAMTYMASNQASGKIVVTL